MIVEDGTGLENANAYVDLTYADNYWDAETNNTWARASDDSKEIAIIQATKELDKRFGKRFIGNKADRDQALSWPRINALDTDGFYWNGVVPSAVKNAVCELALLVIQGTDLRNQPSPNATIKSKTVKVGEISTATVYENPLQSNTVTTTIDDILSMLISGGGGIAVKAYRV